MAFGRTGVDSEFPFITAAMPVRNEEQTIAAVRDSPFGHSRRSHFFSEHEGFVSPVPTGAAYTREVFETIGEFDESFDACEDVEFNLRVEKAGFKSYVSPRLKVLYHARRGPGGLYRQMKRYGRGRFHLLRKHPSAFEWQTLIPPLAVVFALPGSRGFGRRGWPLYPLVFFATYWGLGVGFIGAALADTFSDAVHSGPGHRRRAGK